MEEKENKWKDSQFKSQIRIRTSQLKWLKENKKTKSAAGFLDIIINFYKQNEQQTKL